ncbi:MAG: hypothetical protein K8T90_19695 [Planctomycetes bacterium]|nr:hypothetical protein [Planctomycetota bacterium]
MSDQTPARFYFKGIDLEVEFEGRADFVSAQVDHFKVSFAAQQAAAATAQAPAVPAAPAPAAPAATAATAATVAAASTPAAAPATESTPAAPGAVSLEAFYKNAKSRNGRGALQETILIFGYFLNHYRGKEEFGIDNLNACFSLVGVTPPRSLANTLGIMKRSLKFFSSGSRRGTYSMTEKGNAYVKRLVGNV